MENCFKDNLVDFLNKYNVFVTVNHLSDIDDAKSLMVFLTSNDILPEDIDIVDFTLKLETLFSQKDTAVFSNSYDSIYDLGNSHELSESEYQLTSMARELMIKTGKFDLIDKNSEEYTLHEDDSTMLEEAEDYLDKYFTRQGALVNRLDKYLGFHIDTYDKTCPKQQSEIVKILYFFHMLEHKSYLEYLDAENKFNKNREYFNILVLFDKDRLSLENIDYSFLEQDTFNGKIFRHIINSLDREISLPEKNTIIKSLQTISSQWETFLRLVIFEVSCLTMRGEAFIQCAKLYLKPVAPAYIFITTNTNAPHNDSPLETLYLRVCQHQYLSHIGDIKKIYGQQTVPDYTVPQEFISIIKTRDWKKVAIGNVESYIDENCNEIAKYVFYKFKPTAKNCEKVRGNKDKVRRWINFCIRSRSVFEIEESLTELLIISCLQAIIHDKANTFDYSFPLSQHHMKKVPTLSAALLRDERVPDALQLYWVEKVLIRLYANIGMHEIRNVLRDYFVFCYDILTQIFSCSNIDEMVAMHGHYFDCVTTAFDKFRAVDTQAKALMDFLSYLRGNGFEFIDDNNDIYYVFTYSAEATYVKNALTSFVEASLVYKKSMVHIQIRDTEKKYLPFEIALVTDSENRNTPLSNNVVIDFKLLFDYRNKTCTMAEFKLRDAT